MSLDDIHPWLKYYPDDDPEGRWGHTWTRADEGAAIFHERVHPIRNRLNDLRPGQKVRLIIDAEVEETPEYPNSKGHRRAFVVSSVNGELEHENGERANAEGMTRWVLRYTGSLEDDTGVLACGIVAILDRNPVFTSTEEADAYLEALSSAAPDGLSRPE